MKINLEYINPFFESGVQVLGDILNENLIKSDMQIQNSLFRSKGVTAVVGITKGRIVNTAINLGKGRILLDMPKETAIKIAEKIYGEEYGLINNEVFEAITELCNMIAGAGITKINNNNNGMNLRLTPPSIFAGDNLEINSPKLNAIGVSFKLSFGEISLNVAFEAAKEV